MSEEQRLVHVRFAPNGTVTEISERPVSLGAQEWFDHLTQKTSASYHALSNGRGVFRLTQTAIDALKPA